MAARFKYTHDDIAAVLRDIDRRVAQAIAFGEISDADSKGYRETLLKGMYSALLVLADDPIKAAVQIHDVEEAQK